MLTSEGRWQPGPREAGRDRKNWEPVGWSLRENTSLHSAARQLSDGPGTVLCTTPGGPQGWVLLAIESLLPQKERCPVWSWKVTSHLTASIRDCCGCSVTKSEQCAQVFENLWTAALQASLSITNSGVHQVNDAIQPSHSVSLLLLPSIFPSIRVFPNESALCIRWPKAWSFNISPSNEYSGLISFRIDWFDHLAVQGTLKSLLQHHSSKASILQCLAFFMVQLSHLYMTTGKTIALTIQTNFLI